MAEAASAQQAASATDEDTSQQRAGRRRRTSADPQRAQQGAPAAAAPAALDTLSRLQQLADASPQAAQLRRLQALADASPQVAQLRRLQALADASPQAAQLRRLQALADAAAGIPSPTAAVEAAPPNRTGLPDGLKAGVESLSGLSMDHVRVHYNSAQPAQLNALAYAQGSDIHLAPGQEQHLPHEAWHVVQQRQGRVKPTMQMKDGVQVNDDVGLEREADVMGTKALEGGHRAVEAHRSVSMPIETEQPIDGDAMNSREVNVANNHSAPLASGRGSAQRGGNELQRIADQRPDAALQRQVQAWGDGRGAGGKGQDLTLGFAARRITRAQKMRSDYGEVAQQSIRINKEVLLPTRTESQMLQRKLNSSIDVAKLRKKLKTQIEHIILNSLQKDEEVHPYPNGGTVLLAIKCFADFKGEADRIQENNSKELKLLEEVHDLAQSDSTRPGPDTSLLQQASQLNSLAMAWRKAWKWEMQWIMQLREIDSQISELIQQTKDSVGVRQAPQLKFPPQVPLKLVGWGNDSINHLVDSKQKLTSDNMEEVKKEIGNIRGKDNDDPRDENGPLKGAIPYFFIQSARQALLELAHQVNDSVAIFSLERGGSLLADHVTDLLSTQLLMQSILNVKVPRSAGLNSQGGYERTRHHLSMVIKMMDTEEGHMFKLISRNPLVRFQAPPITLAICETAISGASVNTLLHTLKDYHTLVPYSKFKLLVEKQTIKENRLVKKPRGGMRVSDPGIDLEKILTTDSIPKIQMFISQAEYILGEDVGYQLSYDQQLIGEPLIIYDQNLRELIAVKLSHSQMLPRDMLRLLIMGAFDTALSQVFDSK